MARIAVRALLFCALLAPASPFSATVLSPSIASAEPPKGRPRAGAKKGRTKAKKEPKRVPSEERAAPAREGRAASREAKEESTQPEGDGKSEARGAAREQSSDGKALSEAQKLARDAAQGANAQIVKEGDTSVKVMQFSGLDIEGRLKSPQLLYFVSRVHAEFDRPKLPHRSFMPELERSTKEEPIR